MASTQVQLRRGTAAQILAKVPAIGELWYATDTKKLYIGDGSTAGGTIVTGLNGTNGTNGTNGGNVFTGPGAPSAGLGTVSDSYINATNGDTYSKASGAWTINGNIKGIAGGNGTNGTNGANIFAGAGTPSSGLGTVADSYLNTTNGDTYSKASGTWTVNGNIRGTAGTNGTNGNSVLSGSGVPAAGTGNNGDSYMNAANGDTYSKAAGAWTLNGNIRGPQGVAGTAVNGSETTIANSTAATANNTGTGTLGETPMFSVAVPANSIIPQSGTIKMAGWITYNSGGGAKGISIYFGGQRVVNQLAIPTGTTSAYVEVFVTNLGIQNSQISYARISTSAGFAISPTVTSTVATTAAQNIGMYSVLTTSGDVMNTISWKVTALN